MSWPMWLSAALECAGRVPGAWPSWKAGSKPSDGTLPACHPFGGNLCEFLGGVLGLKYPPGGCPNG